MEITVVEISLSAIGAVISVGGVIVGFKHHKIKVKLEVKELLEQAWDQLSGKPGTDLILEASKSQNVVLARRKVESALEIDSNHPQANYVHGVVCEALDDQERAIKSYIKAIKYSDGSKYSYYHNIGRIYLKKRQHENAIQSFKEAALKCDRKAEAYFGLGVVYIERTEWKKAIDAFKQAVEIDRQHKGAYANLIAALGASKQIDVAEKYFREAEELGLINDDILFNALNIYRLRNDRNSFEEIKRQY